VTEVGEVIPCTCGVTDRPDGAIAGTVNAQLWRVWEAVATEIANGLEKAAKKEWAGLGRRERRSRIRDWESRGLTVPEWARPHTQAKDLKEPIESWPTFSVWYPTRPMARPLAPLSPSDYHGLLLIAQGNSGIPWFSL